jgi:hypothetical protein
MSQLPPWMVRNNPEYDPNRIGAITHTKVVAALVAAGKVVLAPFAQVRPYDLVLDEGGNFVRVQCKTDRLFRGGVYFRSHRLRAAKRETGWHRVITDYVGAVDAFGVYCPENDQVYLVPISEVNSRQNCMLRLTPAKNNQQKGVRWANDFLVVPLPMPEPVSDLLLLDD